MGETGKPHDASIDALIDWIGRRRRQHPAAPLSELLADGQLDDMRSTDPGHLVDIACIDLMQRRRMKDPVAVEQYVTEFPCLNTPSHLLDLIDAELCVANELGEPTSLETYTKRFPELASQIQELFQLQPRDEVKPLSDVADVSFAEIAQQTSDDGQSQDDRELDLDVAGEGDFSIELRPGGPTAAGEISTLGHQPVDVPEWFIADQCIASSPGRWLIRGRDSTRGTALALKVTELPTLITAQQRSRILDACEAASKVQHPCWVTPRVAAIQNRHLGVIRPWIFALPWQADTTTNDVRRQLHHLATVAMVVESAHRCGATHGGIHLENVLIDHDGKICILDAASSRFGLQRWFQAPVATSRGNDRPSEGFASLQARKNFDTQDVVKLVAAASVHWDREWSRSLIAEVRRIADEVDEETCGQIGQTLMRYADLYAGSNLYVGNDSQTATGLRAGWGPGRTGSIQSAGSWRGRLARWLTGE